MGYSLFEDLETQELAKAAHRELMSRFAMPIVPNNGILDPDDIERTIRENPKLRPHNYQDRDLPEDKAWNMPNKHPYSGLNGEPCLTCGQPQNKHVAKIAMPMRGPEHESPGSLYPAVQKVKKVQTGKGFDLGEEGLPEPVQNKLSAKWLEPLGLNREAGTQNLRDALNAATPEHWKKGLPWYQEVHDSNVKNANELGYHPEIYHAMTSALSPNTDWNENEYATKALAQRMKDPKYRNMDTEQVVKELAPLIGAGKGGTGKYMGYPESIRKAVELAKLDPKASDEDVLNHIDSTMGGNKTRSFYNNMSDPDKNGNDVTVDKHMISSYLTGMAPDERRRATREFYQNNQSQVGETPSHENTQFGIHPLIADSVRQVTNEYNKAHKTNYTPAQIQAVIWHGEKERSQAFSGKLAAETRQNRVPNPGTLGEIPKEELF